ncbi:sugar ABC transporter ATP-binding protein [Streptomyces malaysiensis]|uniref:sugar ABC transporter ATP-binding protein n=1 Tax=Streptomyces malaysiensis TaxID=92644 RepID=UPI0033DA05FB
MSRPLLRVRGLSKTFPGVRALQDVSLTVSSGEVVALLGHNGSGKSTLVKILAGVYDADDGAEIQVPAPESSGRGLHFIHQDLGLIASLTAVENIDLAKHLKKRALRPFRTRQERSHAKDLLARFGTDLDVTVPVSGLSPTERTLVAIARALGDWQSTHNVLILDEPTAALNADGVGSLFTAVRRLAADGTGVLFISHRLEEVVELADRVVVLRDGRVAAERLRGDFDRASLTELIAGGHLEGHRTASGRDFGPIRLRVEEVTGPELAGVSFTARAGEVVGISGLLGSGAETLTGAVFGSSARTSGRVLVDGTAIPPENPGAAVKTGVVLAPADRRRLGAFVTMTARENITLPLLSPLRRASGRLDFRAEKREARQWMDDVDVRPRGSIEKPFGLFSGGNQQKIVLGKWLRTRPKVLLLEEPTQGVDVGALAGIYQLIETAAADGAAVVVASSDTEELCRLCDRVLVLGQGRITAELSGRGLTEADLVRATLGGAEAAHPSFAHGGSR